MLDPFNKNQLFSSTNPETLQALYRSSDNHLDLSSNMFLDYSARSPAFDDSTRAEVPRVKLSVMLEETKSLYCTLMRLHSRAWSQFQREEERSSGR
jgi:hypothetical protein